jgi:hypothetical protein
VVEAIHGGRFWAVTDAAAEALLDRMAAVGGEA